MPPKKSKTAKPPCELPPVPEYIPLAAQFEPHEAAGLSKEYCTSEIDVFKQLFTQDIWDALRDNTNAYY